MYGIYAYIDPPGTTPGRFSAVLWQSQMGRVEGTFHWFPFHPVRTIGAQSCGGNGVAPVEAERTESCGASPKTGGPAA